jgi:uncharacterized protein
LNKSENDLNTLLRTMAPVLSPDEFVYASVDSRALPKEIEPICTFTEAEGLSIIVEREQADRARLPWILEVRMITLTVHSDLEAVGFIARISAVLAKAHIPCNVVSACFHDYIFVPCELAPTALYLLIALTGTANTPTSALLN